MNEHIDYIRHAGQVLALIVRAEYRVPGITFFTDGQLSQQLGHMRHPVGKVILPHIHNPVVREVMYTQEVLFIKSGSLRVDFYNESQEYLESRVLRSGDVVLLAKGGHGFEVLDEVEMFEVKQGPYAGESDKTRFDGISADQVRLP